MKYYYIFIEDFLDTATKCFYMTDKVMNEIHKWPRRHMADIV